MAVIISNSFQLFSDWCYLRCQFRCYYFNEKVYWFPDTYVPGVRGVTYVVLYYQVCCLQAVSS